jgi:cytochrome c oxidase subunit 2
MSKENQVKKTRFERSLVIIVVLIIAISTYGVIYWSQTYRFPVIGGDDDSKTFYIVATMWEFYPSEIRVQKGDNVTLHLTSLDVRHGFYIEAWNITADLFTNTTVTMNFIADKAGEFEYYCTVYCGIGHSNMRATIIVEEEQP